MKSPYIRMAEKALEAERRRQLELGYDAAHDDAHTQGQLWAAALCYFERGSMEHPGRFPAAEWPWRSKAWKPGTAERDLIRAGALFGAEIERLHRAAAAGEKVRGCRPGAPAANLHRRTVRMLAIIYRDRAEQAAAQARAAA